MAHLRTTNMVIMQNIEVILTTLSYINLYLRSKLLTVTYGNKYTTVSAQS